MPSILLVEGSEMVRKSIEALLEKEGYDVVSAKNGTEAIHCLGLINYNIVITDLAMPQVTGIDLVKYIKSDESKANMGIIVVSSLVDERSRLECLRLGVDEFLTKPVMPFDFLLRVKKLIANNAPQEEE